MVKTELLREYTERLNDTFESLGFNKKLNQKEVDVVISTFETMIIENLSSNKDEKIPFGKLGAFKVKEVPEKSGVSKIGGIEKPWHVDAHNEITFKMNKSAKNI